MLKKIILTVLLSFFFALAAFGQVDSITAGSASGLKNPEIKFKDAKNAAAGLVMVKVGENIVGETSADFGSDLAVYTELWDTYGRCLAKKEGVGKFSFDTKNILRLGGFIKIHAYDKSTGKFVAEKSSAFIAGLPESEKCWDDWEIITIMGNGGPGLKSFAECDPWAMGTNEDIGRFSEYGIRLISSGMIGNGVNEVSKGWWDHIANEVSKAKDKRKKLVRVPCINSPSFKGIVNTVAPKYSRFYSIVGSLGGNGYINGDEQSYTSYTREMDYCYCEYCMKEFRSWLKTQYKSIAELNEEWNTKYASFDEADPPLTEEAKADKTKIAGWADHRTFANITFAKSYQMILDKLKEGDPGAKLSISGTQAPAAFGGYDWERLCKVFGMQQSYWDGAGAIKRSFNPNLMDAPWRGYGESAEKIRFAIWKYLFNNVCGVSYYTANHSPAWREMADLKVLFRKRGISKALRNAERPHDGIAIYYSQPSINAAYMANDKLVPDYQELADLLENAGWQFNFISPEMLKENVLEKARYKLLFLQDVAAMSKEEAGIIHSWVEKGGSIFATLNTATSDEHCKPYKQPLLADLFESNSTAPYSIKKTGKGFAFYQPGSISKYNRKSYYIDKSFISYLKDLKKDFSEKCGIKSPFTLTDINGDPLYRSNLYRYEDGPIKYACVLQEKNSNIDPVRKFKVNLDKTYNIYNMKTGKFVGTSDSITDEIKQADGAIYALLPYPVGSVKVNVSAPSMKPGGDVGIEFSVVPASGEKAAEHVVRVTAYGPDGNEMPGVARNILAKDGKGEYSVFVPYNINKGDIKIECTDGPSGVSGSSLVKVE